MKVINSIGKNKLTNSGELEIFFLGAGNPFSKTLFNNNFFIIKGDTHILVDFGFNAPTALMKYTDIKPSDISAILPTHSHSDHVGGIEYLTLQKRYSVPDSPQKLDMIITDDYREILWERTLRGGLEWNEYCQINKEMAFDDYYNHLVPGQLNNEKRATYEINYNGIKLELFHTNHIPECAKTPNDAFTTFGLMVNDNVLISCDTKFDKELIDSYPQAEYIFYDCSLRKNPVHACLDELKTLPKEIKDKMYLMHYGDDWENYEINDFKGFVKEGHSYLL